MTSKTLFAQPANDDCGGAYPVNFASSEQSAVLVDGDSRNATASPTSSGFCSGSWYTDDTWYSFTTPSTFTDESIIIRTYFNNATNPTDVSSVGMALYSDCNPTVDPLRCFSSDDPEVNELEVPVLCLLADHTYYVRIWAADTTTVSEGTFKVGVFSNSEATQPLWYESFNGGIEANGWTTEGSCAVADSNINAGWKYLPDGLLDKGAYIFDGAGINSPSLCDGAVGVDSDFDDNAGVQGNFGGGPCPAPAQHILISPEIPTSEWTAVGISLTWTQAIRQFQSTYFVSYRIKDGDNAWSDWVDFQVNTEFATNGNFDNSNVQRIFLSGAAGHDFLQIRFVYNANYYMWGIDDVKLVETEANNPRIQSNFYAIAPWATIPENQVYPFGALADIRNAGAADQTNVVLNHTVVNSDTQAEIYNSNLSYGTIVADSTYENRLNPDLIVLPLGPSNYTATYTLTADQPDFDPSDNVISFNYSVGGNTFGLEDGFTRSVAVANSIYDAGAPLSYAYGNYFRPVVDATVDRIIWGVNNPGDMTDKTVQIYLLQWTDTNGDRIAESSERRFIGFADYTFTGTEGDNAILESTLENFDNPGDPIVMKGGFGYIAIVEYQASVSTDPQFFILASEARNYGAQVLAMDTAVSWNLQGADFVYSSVLGFSPDGNIANIDYEVTELDVNDDRVFFGHDIVPLVRVVVNATNTVDQLPLDNSISAYPNPASDFVQVKLEFTKPYSDVKIRLMDNLGRVVYYRALEGSITEQVEKISVRDLSAGSYLLQVETIDGQRSVPVMVAK